MLFSMVAHVCLHMASVAQRAGTPNSLDIMYDLPSMMSLLLVLLGKS